MPQHADIAAEPLAETSAPYADEANARAVIARQLAMLDDLAAFGMRIAAALVAQAEAQPAAEPDAPPRDLNDIALAFSRVSRAVRMTCDLQTRLLDTLRGWDDEQARKTRLAAIDEAFDRREAGEARKETIDRIVQRVALDEHRDDAEAVERLVQESRERLSERELYGDVLDRPVSELVGLICRDLGLTPDWPRLAEEAWAQDEIASGNIGPPLAALHEQPSLLASPRLKLDLDARRREAAQPPDPPDPNVLTIVIPGIPGQERPRRRR